MPREFANLLEKLAEGGVRYLVVGGVAVGLHGFIRATADLDIIVQANEDNARRLLQVLGDWGEGLARELMPEEFATPEGGSVRIHEEEEFTLDVFTLMRARGSDQDLDFETLARDASFYRLPSGIRVPFISTARLIELKTGTGRPKDANDIDVLREIQRGARPGDDARLETMVPTPAANSTPGADEASSDAGEWPLR